MDGWKCPGCGRCYAPWMWKCGACDPSQRTTTTTAMVLICGKCRKDVTILIGNLCSACFGSPA